MLMNNDTGKTEVAGGQKEDTESWMVKALERRALS